jgi:signal transduction histidine kinase
VTRIARLTNALPEWMRSARWRITIVYTTALFLLAALLLGAVYLSVHMSLQRETVASSHWETVAGNPEAIVRVAPEGTQVFLNAHTFEAAVNAHVLDTLRTFSLEALGMLFLVGLGAGWVIAGRILAPIDRITGVAQRIQATDLSQRIDLEGPNDELKRLADTFDGMLARLDEAFGAQRRFIADASHELRNPLAIIRTNLDVDLTDPSADPDRMRHGVAVVKRATERMSRLIDDLLALARLDAPAALEQRVDVSAFAAEVVDDYAAAASERGVLLQRSLPVDVEARGDVAALKRAVGNLLDNALRYAPRGTPVSIHSGKADGWAFVAVEDHGPGIRPEDQSRVFERFWRSDKARSREAGGSGLGLAIVAQIVGAHGGAVRLFSEPGEGSTFVIWLPVKGSGIEGARNAPTELPRPKATFP